MDKLSIPEDIYFLSIKVDVQKRDVNYVIDTRKISRQYVHADEVVTDVLKMQFKRSRLVDVNLSVLMKEAMDENPEFYHLFIPESVAEKLLQSDYDLFNLTTFNDLI